MKHSTKTVSKDAINVLGTENADAKAARAIIFGDKWKDKMGNLPVGKCELPPKPARPQQPLMVRPAEVPRRRINRNISGRIALLHALAHIELNAIDLACDLIARFAGNPMLPNNFARDWIGVATDEAKHFQLLARRLKELDSYYGDLPAHDSLWEVAEKTADDLLGRLAIVPLVLEARGLDVTPPMISKLRKVEDHASADILEVIHNDEITHVAVGQRWFQYLCERMNLNPSKTFHALVRQYFNGQLKPPFNKDSRDAAGIPRSFYTDLVHEETSILQHNLS